LGKPERKRPFGRPSCRWDDHVRMDLREVGWEVVDRNHVAVDGDHFGFHKGGEYLDQLSDH
jgi:hypothetical protein